MIFLSYSWHESLYVHALANYLAKGNKKIWLDIWYLDLKKSIPEQLEKAINESSYLVLIDSPNSRLSKWVGIELEFAKKTKTPVKYITYNSTVANTQMHNKLLNNFDPQHRQPFMVHYTIASFYHKRLPVLWSR